MQRHNQQQHWNAIMWPPAQHQQPSAQHPPPRRQPYYYGGNQKQHRNPNMRPPAQQRLPLGQHPSPPQQPYHYGDRAAENVGGVDEVRTLFIERLRNWMDEDYLKSCFGQTGQLVSVKIIRNKRPGQSEGYGFLVFKSHAAAENILQSFNDEEMPNAEQSLKLSWAGHSAEDFEIFVGNLDAAVTDSVLLETFKSEYPSVMCATIVRDRATGRSKGCGFVKFEDETEKNRSMLEMKDRQILNRTIRIGTAYGKTPLSAQPQRASHQNPQGASDPNNTTVFVGGLHPNATSEDLRRAFSRFGDVASATALRGRYFGFVRFSDRSSAETAMTSRYRNSIEVRGKTVRLRWDRGTPNRQNQSGASQYGYSQGYGNTHLGYANYQHHHRQ